MAGCEIIRQDYQPSAPSYDIIQPEIPTGDIYYFFTKSGLEYEVRFCRKKDNFLGHVINFGVLNDEFENEYSVTNRGEIYRIISTVIEIIRIFHSQHSTSNSYEFTGEFKFKESDESSIRSKLYYRYALRVLCPEWKPSLMGSKVIVTREKVHQKSLLTI